MLEDRGERRSQYRSPFKLTKPAMQTGSIRSGANRYASQLRARQNLTVLDRRTIITTGSNQGQKFLGRLHGSPASAVIGDGVGAMVQSPGRGSSAELVASVYHHGACDACGPL
jgi:hypothetical protein